LNPLPYPDSDRIVDISHSGGGGLNEPTFTYLATNNPGLQDLAAYQAGAGVNLTDGDRTERVGAIRASLSYLRLFGANPILGRTFSAEDDRRGAPSVLVMSFGLWQRRFGGNPSVVGRAIALGGASYIVVGASCCGKRESTPLRSRWKAAHCEPPGSIQW
jgi:putative ABC transport system permease protein